MNKKYLQALIIVTLLFIGAILPQTTNAQNNEDSKFSIFGAYALEYTWFMQQMGFNDSDYWNWVDYHFQKLGAHWTRSNTQICLVAPTQGFSVNTFLENTIIELSSLNVQFDIIDIHHWGISDNYKMTALPHYRTLLNNNGYSNVDIWSCEHGTHCY